MQTCRKDTEGPAGRAPFRRILEAVPFSQLEFEDAIAALDAEPGPVLRAVKFFIVCRQSRAGRVRSVAPIGKHGARRGMNKQFWAWLTAVAGLPQVHARLRRVLILNTDALEVIRSQDGKDVLFYWIRHTPASPAPRSAS